MRTLNPITNFINEVLLIDENYKQNKSDLYKEYQHFCKENDIIDITLKKKFNKVIEAKFGKPFKNNTMYYRGFKVK